VRNWTKGNPILITALIALTLSISAPAVSFAQQQAQPRRGCVATVVSRLRQLLGLRPAAINNVQPAARPPEPLFAARAPEPVAAAVEPVQPRLTALANAYPADAWTGTLEHRINELQQRWPKNIRNIENAKFTLAEGDMNSSQQHRVIAISLYGLDNQQQQQLVNDYTRALANGTISFPLNSRQGHLYTRLGAKTYDNYHRLGENDYRASTAARLEPVVELTPDEEANLRTYVENARNNLSGVVGRFEMAGVANRRTAGQLADNRPLDANVGHNCTSWMCLAPVGQNGETVAAIVGNRSGEFHTNPGWWGAYLTSVARRRVPFIVYMDGAPMDQILPKFSPDTPFVWNYYLH
jgi:hypothetical protein